MFTLSSDYTGVQFIMHISIWLRDVGTSENGKIPKSIRRRSSVNNFTCVNQTKVHVAAGRFWRT